MLLLAADVQNATAMKEPAGGLLDETESELLSLVAYLHLRYGDPEKATAYLNVLSRMRPDDPVINRSLAILRMRVGDPVGAAEAAERSLTEGADDRGQAASHLLLGIARSLAGDSGRSSESFETFRKLRSATKTSP